MPEIPEGFAPVHDLGVGDALDGWRWLVGTSAQPRLLTAMGDLIVVKPVGVFGRQAVFLLDSYAGTFEQIASSWDEFKGLVSQAGEDVFDWLKADLVTALREEGTRAGAGRVLLASFSPPLSAALTISTTSRRLRGVFTSA